MFIEIASFVSACQLLASVSSCLQSLSYLMNPFDSRFNSFKPMLLILLSITTNVCFNVIGMVEIKVIHQPILVFYNKIIQVKPHGNCHKAIFIFFCRAYFFV